MKSRKTTINSNVKKNKSLHKKKQKVSRSIAKKQFVSKHAPIDSLTNELINLQKNNEDYSTYGKNNDDIQHDSDSFIQSNISALDEENIEKDNFLVQDVTAYITKEDAVNVDFNESYISNMFKTTLEEKKLEERDSEDNMFSFIIDEKDIEEVHFDEKIDSDLDDIKYKEIENEKTKADYKDISEVDFIQEIPNDNIIKGSEKDLTINISKELKLEDSYIEEVQVNEKTDITHNIKIPPISKKNEEDIDEKTIINKDNVLKNKINILSFKEITTISEPVISDSEEEFEEIYDDEYYYDDKKRIISYGFLRGVLFTLLFVSITLLLFTAPFIIAYVALGFLLVVSSFAVAASAFVYLENYNSGIKRLINQVYPELHERISNYSFILGVVAIIIIIILYKLIYTLHSNYFSWCFRFLHKQFTGLEEYDDEIEDVEESLEY